MSETFTIAVIVITGLSWVVLAVISFLFYSRVSPNIKLAREILERARSLVSEAEEVGLVTRAGNLLGEAEGVVLEIKARLAEISPTIERLPSLVDEAEGAIKGIRRLLDEAEEKGIVGELKALLEKVANLIDDLRGLAANLDEIIGRANEVRKSVDESITVTRDRLEDAINILGGVKAGIRAGLKAFTAQED